MSDNRDQQVDQRWLTAALPFVREHLPPPPARVLEIGCGPLGGFVPALELAGYDVVGVDPDAPDGDAFVRSEFEQYDVGRPLDAVVACTSLHHVRDLDEVLDLVRGSLTAGGTFVVVEWAHERFDDATAQWCFDRLPDSDSDALPRAAHRHVSHRGHDDEHEHRQGSWLGRHRAEWAESGLTWSEYRQGWTEAEGLHTGEAIVAALDARFECRHLTRGPYFFPVLDLARDVEQTAIDAGEIQPAAIRFAGRRA
ncbi:MAG TPA: class I SAM-dependent methyltransferase [Nocardioidaceae bacterium]|nr:class I SAM-dependent methyltransferase [Nocardioidaceae bacterium]